MMNCRYFAVILFLTALMTPYAMAQETLSDTTRVVKTDAASELASSSMDSLPAIAVKPADRVTRLLTTPVLREESFTLSGQVLDAETDETAPYVSIRVERLGLMTVSNEDGRWTLKLPSTAAKEIISFKYLGYSTQSIDISRLPNTSVVYLKPSSVELKEVVISPEKKFEILRGAWNAITTNYPVEPTLTQGFYRETQRVNDSLFLYFNEAVLNVFKNTYRNNQNFGQIEVTKSRKNVFPGIDSINDVRFYGGPHFPNELDIVFSRWDFIKPSDFKNWSYDLEGGFSDNGHFVYTIAFKHKVSPLSNFQGRMFIDGDSYAYLGFELKRFGLASFNSAEDLSTDAEYVSGTTSIEIGYVEKGDKYILGHINYKTNGINTVSQVRVFKDIEYVTTSIRTESVEPIPYERQFDYTDILSIEADNYDQGFWKDYNVLQESQLQTKQTQLLYGQEKAIEQLTRVYNTELTQQEKTLLFLKRFTFEGGFSFHPLQSKGGNYVIGYGMDPLFSTIPPTGDQAETISFGLSTTDGIRFSLNKNWSLFGTISTALYGMDQFQTSLGLNFRTPLFPSGRWVFLDLGLGPDFSTSMQKLGKMVVPGGNVTIEGKKLEAPFLQVKAGQQAFGAIGKAGISVRMGKQYELFAEGNYQLRLLKRSFVQFKEGDGFFLTRSKSKVDWNNANLYLWLDEHQQGNYMRMTSPTFNVEPWYIRIGIRSGF